MQGNNFLNHRLATLETETTRAHTEINNLLLTNQERQLEIDHIRNLIEDPIQIGDHVRFEHPSTQSARYAHNMNFNMQGRVKSMSSQFICIINSRGTEFNRSIHKVLKIPQDNGDQGHADHNDGDDNNRGDDDGGRWR